METEGRLDSSSDFDSDEELDWFIYQYYPDVAPPDYSTEKGEDILRFLDDHINQSTTDSDEVFVESRGGYQLKPLTDDESYDEEIYDGDEYWPLLLDNSDSIDDDQLEQFGPLLLEDSNSDDEDSSNPDAETSSLTQPRWRKHKIAPGW